MRTVLLVEAMQLRGLQPDVITFTSVISAFGKGWMALRVLRLFAEELQWKLLFRESNGRTVVVWSQVRGRFNAGAATPSGSGLWGLRLWH